MGGKWNGRLRLRLRLRVRLRMGTNSLGLLILILICPCVLPARGGRSPPPHSNPDIFSINYSNKSPLNFVYSFTNCSETHFPAILSVYRSEKRNEVVAIQDVAAWARSRARA